MRLALALAATLVLPACLSATDAPVARFDGTRVTLHTAPSAPTRQTDTAAAALCDRAGKVARYAWTNPAEAGFDHLYLCF